MIFLRTALTLLLAVLGAQQAHAAQAGSGQSGLCSYTPATTPLTGNECWPLNQNGVTKTITATQFFKNAIQGPGSSTVGDAATFSNTGGTALADAGARPALFAADTTAMTALPVTPFAEGAKVRVGTYSVSGGITAPPIDYYLTGTSCTIDNGSCFASSNISKYWHITPQAIWDPRWWGAKADAQRAFSLTTVTASSCLVTVAGATFDSTGHTDDNKHIVITDGTTGSPNPVGVNGPTYSSTIASVQSATQITVSAPCPTFASSQNQAVYWGSDNAAAINNSIQYLKNFQAQGLSGQPVLDGGGLAYGVYSAPILVNANISFNNFRLVALGANNFPVNTSGLLNIAASFSTGYNDVADAAFLPINACTGTNNGRILWYMTRCINWMGSTANSATFTAVSTINSATVTASIGTCVNGTVGQRCLLTVTSVASGRIQPGDGLSDSGVNIPNGTFVLDYADSNTTGFVGTYHVYNATQSIGTVTSQSMNALSHNLNVNSCVPLPVEQVNGSNVSGNIGMVSHGNVATGLQDRAFIVGCTSNVITVNKAPNKTMAAATLFFFQDSNGVFVPNSVPGIANIGVQYDQLSTNLDFFLGNAGNQYGCAIYDDSDGGSGYTGASTFQGAAGICLGSKNKGARFFFSQHISNYGDPVTYCCEVGGPAILAMDGSDNSVFEQFQASGQIQKFNISLGTAAPKFQLINPNFLASNGSVLFAPAVQAWFYNDAASIQTDNITYSPYGVNQQTFNFGTEQGVPGMLGFTVGPNGSWSQYTNGQLALMMRTQNVMMPANSSAGMVVATDLLMNQQAIVGAFVGRESQSGAYTLTNADCGYLIQYTTPSGTITIPRTLAGVISAKACVMQLISGTGAPYTISAGTGTTLYNAGSSVSSVSVAANTPVTLSCSSNSDGNSAICFAIKHIN